MKKYLLPIFLLLLFAPAAFAQNTTVSASFSDANSQALAYGSWTIKFSPSPSSPSGPYSWNGSPFNIQTSYTGTLNGSGALTAFSIQSTNFITPTGNSWTLTVCPAATVNCSSGNVIITGSTQSLSSAITIPAIQVQANTSNQSAAYSDAEIQGAIPGYVYWNITSSTLRVCAGPLPCTWTAVGGGGGGGCTLTATAGEVVYSPSGTNCAGIAGSSANSTGNVTLAPPATGVALTITGAPSGTSDGIDIAGNFGSANGAIFAVTNNGGIAFNGDSYDTNGASGPNGASIHATETDATGAVTEALGGDFEGFLQGTNVGGDKAIGMIASATDLSTGGAAAMIVGLQTGYSCTARTLLCYGEEIVQNNPSVNGVTTIGLKIDALGAAAIVTDPGDTSSLGLLTAATVTDSALTSGRCVQAGTAGLLGNAAAACGVGTVTSFSAGNLSPLFTSSVATSTTTPALSFTLSNAGAFTLFGNNTSSSAAPSYTTMGSIFGSCSGAANALTFNSTTNAFGCNTIGGGGTVNSGTATQMAYYASTGTAVSGDAALTDSGTLLTYTGSGGAILNPTGSSITAFVPSNTLLAIANSGASTRLSEISFGGTPFISGVAVGGTVGSPTAVTSGTQLGGINSFAYNGTGLNGPIASFRTYANQTQTTSNGGSYADIATTPNGSLTAAEVVRFENDAGVTVPSTVTGGDKGAGTINAGGLYVNGVAVATGTGANTALSNLASVAINAALLPGTTNSIALGSSSFYWTNIFSTAENCGIAGTTSCVMTGNGSTSGAATLTWPAVAGTATNPITSSNNWSVPALIATAAGAASAPAIQTTGAPYAGTNANSFGQLDLTSGSAAAIVTLNTAGTYFTIRQPTGGTADLANWFTGTASEFKVTFGGAETITSNFQAGGNITMASTSSNNYIATYNTTAATSSACSNAGKFEQVQAYWNGTVGTNNNTVSITPTCATGTNGAITETWASNVVPLNVVISGAFSASTSITDSGLTAGACEQPTTGGLLASAAGPCAIAINLATGTPTFTAGTNVTSVACASGYTCTNERGELTIVGGTATTGTIATVNFSATLSAAPGLCIVTQEGGATLFGIGHGTPSTSSFTITAGVSVAASTLAVDYICRP